MLCKALLTLLVSFCAHPHFTRAVPSPVSPTVVGLGHAIYQGTFHAVPSPGSSTVVDLGYAIYQGTFNETANTTDFLGIRYAAPPVGKLRFQAPAPPLNERHLGVQLADTQPAGCNIAGIGGGANQDNLEDCLFLSVSVSGPFDPAAAMPVLVWIHGGGYISGSTIGMSGDDIIPEAGGGLVVVTIDYRLGVFGFLAGSEVNEKGALNAGLLDQQAVLQWIQQNIHLFGGNPDDVTIWGESAGAGSVLQHIVANGGNTVPPLFKNAMISSLWLPAQYRFNDTIPEQIYSDALRLTGCSNATDTFDCLVNIDEGILQAANAEINPPSLFDVLLFAPVIDGKFSRSTPSAQILTGVLNGERLLTVLNSLEGRIFVNSSERTTLPEFIAQHFPTLDADQINQVAAQYENVSTLPTVDDQAVARFGEFLVICPNYLLLNSFKGPAYTAEFAIPPGIHASDIAYYFPGWPSPNAPVYSNPQFHASFAGAFTAFAKSGDPNVHPVPDVITPNWEQYKYGNTEMLFNRTEDFQPDIRAITTDAALLERCAFWESILDATAQ